MFEKLLLCDCTGHHMIDIISVLDADALKD
jgi:hypothetical protein